MRISFNLRPEKFHESGQRLRESRVTLDGLLQNTWLRINRGSTKLPLVVPLELSNTLLVVPSGPV